MRGAPESLADEWFRGIVESTFVFWCLLLLAVSFVSGCAGSFEDARDARIMLHAAPAPRDAEHCKAIDDRHEFMVGAAWLDGSLAGATGALGAGLSQVDGMKPGWPIGLGIASVVFAGQVVYATVAADAAAKEWASQCAQ